MSQPEEPLGGHVTSKIFPVEHTPILARTWFYEGDDVTHDHTFLEVATVLRGTAVHRTIYGDQQIEPGDAFILQPGAWHAYVRCQRLLLYNLGIGREILNRELAWTREDPLLSYLLWMGPRDNDRRGILRLRLDEESLRDSRMLLDEVARASASTADTNRADQIGRLLVLIGHLARHIELPHAYASKPQQHHPAVDKGIKLLESHLSDQWSLTSLAEQLDIDNSYLVRLFKRDTGLSPIAYLNRARAEHAAVLLLRTDAQISEIAVKVGWDDPNYFARRFRAHFRMTASEYRRRTPGTQPGRDAQPASGPN